LKFEVKSGDISKTRCDAIIVNLFEGTTKPGGATGAVDQAMGGAISDLIAAGEIKGKTDELHLMHTLGKIPARLIVVSGLGKKEEFNLNKIRNLMGDAVRELKKHKCKSVATILHGAGAGGVSAVQSAEAIAEGCVLGSYEYKKHVTAREDEDGIGSVLLMGKDESNVKAIRVAAQRGEIIGRAACLARDMVNEPSNHMTPAHMADIAKKVAAENGLDIVVMERQQMEKEGMGALLGVAQGTAQPPRFIVLSYRGNPGRRKAIGFVGKGLTFDSGGISLKPQEGMVEMKGDMAGGADVIAAVGAIAALKLKVNVTAIIPATENLPGGRALKPGDVLKVSNGKTIEVVNTDAEGRLILSDALSYSVKQGVSPLIDLATLTGACHVALGDLYAGVFGNDQALVDSVMRAGAEAGEYLWQLPLPEEYKELNKSDIADIKNSGGRYGGAITGALFLQEFVGKTPWVHMDIAGPFMAEKTKGVLVKGATGFGVRTLIRLAINIAEEGGVA